MSRLTRFLESAYAPLITHGLLASTLAAEYWMILRLPLWAALAPCVLLQHRIGILLHDYVHGSPFRRYRHSLWVLTAVDSLLLNFGAFEVFRGTHLAHHRWMNTPQDPGFWVEPPDPPKSALIPALWRFFQTLRGDVSLYFRFLRQPNHPHYTYVKGFRVALAFGLSAAWLVLLAMTGLDRVAVALVVIQVCLIPPLVLRAAIEHSSWHGDSRFANEYHVYLPLMNRNRHVHHHLEPARPWYLLRFVTPDPLPPLSYWKHWRHVFIARDYTLMQPLRGSEKLPEKQGVV